MKHWRISEEHEGIGVQHFSPSAGMAGISEKPWWRSPPPLYLLQDETHSRTLWNINENIVNYNCIETFLFHRNLFIPKKTIY